MTTSKPRYAIKSVVAETFWGGHAIGSTKFVAASHAGIAEDLAEARALAHDVGGIVVTGLKFDRATRCYTYSRLCPKCNSATRLCRDNDPACVHCDACGWAGDPGRRP
jgi:hypothetical protein